MSDKNYITYAYTPDGRKLSSRHVTYTPTDRGTYHRLSITDLYVDGLILRNNTPLLWQFDGGYVELNENGTPTSWNYYITDHLGSTRKVVDSNNNVKETINYYPFGSEMKMQDPAQMAGDTWQPYRFTSKELDMMHGLNTYDYGARQYYPLLPMWDRVDPLAEDNPGVSPYMYCAGDPVNKIDPDGRDWFKTEGGYLCWQPDVHSQDDLQEGYNYIGESLEADGVLYRDDGTIIFPQECQAYERILYQLNRSRSNIHPLGKEQMAFILDDGSVMVMPDNWNDCETSTYKQTGITRDDHVLTDKHGEKFGYVAQIHTHTKGADKGLSLGDMQFAKADPDISVFVMHGDGNVYGGYYSSKRGGIDTWSNNPLLSIGSLRRGKNSLRQRAVFYRNK